MRLQRIHLKQIRRFRTSLVIDQLEPGINVFGLPDGEVPQTLVTMNGPKPGDTVTVFVEAEGLGEDERQAPVLDGTLPEYKDLVP